MKGSEWRDDQVAPFGEPSGSGGELAPPRLVLFSGDLAASVALAQDDECTIPLRASVCEPPDSGDDRSDDNTSLRAALQGALRKQAAEDPLTEFERLRHGGSGTLGGRVGVAPRS
jgi:hypothetical protein